MAMKSMDSAVSGLRAQQTAMDVIGNNIANVNTAGFRSSSTQFEDLFYQTLNSASAETDPSQVGLGSQVANVSKNMTSGGPTTTSKPTDLYINGSGYYCISTGNAATDTTPEYYTRVGNFKFDTNGYLVDGSGNYVLGATVDTSKSPNVANAASAICIGSCVFKANDAAGTTTTISSTNYGELTDIAFSKDGTITGSLNGQSGVFYATGGTNKLQIGLATFVNESGLTQVGGNYYQASQSSGKGAESVAGLNGNSTQIESGALEASNTDIASEFTTMIKTQRGFQACSRVITTSDTLYEELINLKRS